MRTIQSQTNKAKSTGIFFIVAAALYAICRVMSIVQGVMVADRYDVSGSGYDLTEAILASVQNILIISSSFVLLALYCFKFHKTEKGKFLYVIGLGIYIFMLVYNCYKAISTSYSNVFTSAYSHIDMWERLLFLIALILMLVVKFKANLGIAMAGTVAFGGYAALQLLQLAVDLHKTANGYSVSILDAFRWPRFILSQGFNIILFLAFFKLWLVEGGNVFFQQAEASTEEDISGEAPVSLQEESLSKADHRQFVCQKCFVILQIVTFLVWCAPIVSYLVTIIKNESVFTLSDFFKLLAVLALHYVLPLVLAFMAEYVFYLGIKYFLGEKETKTTGKNILYALLLVADVAAVVLGTYLMVHLNLLVALLVYVLFS